MDCEGGEHATPRSKAEANSLETGQRDDQAGPIQSDRAEVCAGPSEPPDHLYDEAVAEWKRVAPVLYEFGSPDDGGSDSACRVLPVLCPMDLRRGAGMVSRDRLKTGALVLQTANGNLVQNPLVGIASRAMNDMIKFATDLGYAQFPVTRPSPPRKKLGRRRDFQEDLSDCITRGGRSGASWCGRSRSATQVDRIEARLGGGLGSRASVCTSVLRKFWMCASGTCRGSRLDAIGAQKDSWLQERTCDQLELTPSDVLA